MKRIQYTYCLLSIVLLSACQKDKQHKTFTVKNTIALERNDEVLELDKKVLQVTKIDSSLGIKDLETGKLLVTQLVDVDGDGTVDQLLIQPTIAANTQKEFEIVTIDATAAPTAEDLCFSRFVPERTDDYTWENDKVAFRVYGPTAQQIKESGKPGGTLSSGVDAWLKRVSYPIIDKWYNEYVTKTGSYHEDTGEGLDNFHVGISRGVGGIAIEEDNTYFYSKNYTEYRTITTGPLRTSFYLAYANWEAGSKKITENKVITLDLGSNLSKYELNITGTNSVNAGLTLHEKDGEVYGDNANGYVTYWQPHGDSELATTILADKTTFDSFYTYDVEAKDVSAAYAKLNVVNDKVTYYAGFAWKKSEQYPTKESWNAYLKNFYLKINNPLKIVVE